jgi:hypothetical protein
MATRKLNELEEEKREKRKAQTEAHRVARLEEDCRARRAAVCAAREEALNRREEAEQALVSARWAADAAANAAAQTAESLLALGGEEVDLRCLANPLPKSQSSQTDLSYAMIDDLQSQVDALRSEVQQLREENASCQHSFIRSLLSSDSMAEILPACRRLTC